MSYIDCDVFSGTSVFFYVSLRMFYCYFSESILPAGLLSSFTQHDSPISALYSTSLLAFFMLSGWKLNSHVCVEAVHHLFLSVSGKRLYVPFRGFSCKRKFITRHLVFFWKLTWYTKFHFPLRDFLQFPTRLFYFTVPPRGSPRFGMFWSSFFWYYDLFFFDLLTLFTAVPAGYRCHPPCSSLSRCSRVVSRGLFPPVGRWLVLLSLPEVCLCVVVLFLLVFVCHYAFGRLFFGCTRLLLWGCFLLVSSCPS